MKIYGFPLFAALCSYLVLGMPAVLAQSATEPAPSSPSMEVQRIGLADLNGILRAADANVKVRELLDTQRQKFQDEFSLVEAELQQTERDLMSKRELLSADEYDRQIKAFQARVTQLQQDIQRKRQAIDNAYQKAQSDIRAEALSIITEIARDMNLDLVLNRDASLIFLPHLNISDEVLTRLNERTKNARIEIQVQEPQSQ
ncbi:MAG: OmpH family outer membrane protein [Candidatus Puniceispirillaceae bacterium]|jgi:outer membrane protein|nr:OmpH family outer membrane protein [Pseudomonadota bacterium]MDA0845196.1 OmpH family outer membrane protein [Pseudomonadota bacterium]